jgi:type IV secretion system protein VirB6
MEPLYQTNVFQYLGGCVQSISEAFVTLVSINVVNSVIPLALVATTLYFFVCGYMIAFGHSQNSMQELIKRMVVISIILGLALLEGAYQTNIIALLNGDENTGNVGLEQQLLSLVPLNSISVDGTALTMPNTSDDTIYKRLDESFGKGLEKAHRASELASQNRSQNSMGTMLTEYGCGLVIGLATVVAVFCSGALIILAKLGIAILLAIGPLFIFFLLYPATRRYFDKWLGQLCTYVLGYVLLIIVTVFALTIFNYYLDRIEINEMSTNFTSVPLQLLVISLIILYVVKQVPQIAASLCSGAGLNSPMSAYYAVSSPAGMMIGRAAPNMPGGKTMAPGAAAMPAGSLPGGHSVAQHAYMGPRN